MQVAARQGKIHNEVTVVKCYACCVPRVHSHVCFKCEGWASDVSFLCFVRGEYTVTKSPILRSISVRKNEIHGEYTATNSLALRSISVRKRRFLREHTIKIRRDLRYECVKQQNPWGVRHEKSYPSMYSVTYLTLTGLFFDIFQHLLHNEYRLKFCKDWMSS